MSDDRVYAVWECGHCGQRDHTSSVAARNCCGGYAPSIWSWMVAGVSTIEFSTVHEAWNWIGED